MKRSGAALSAAALSGAAPTPAAAEPPAARRLDAALLRAVAEVVLPTELGDGGREAAVRDFEDWADAYEAVPELNHGYGTSEIRYGPPDPVPGWTAQLEALELEATRRNGAGFAALDASDREELLRRHLRSAGANPPDPLRAEHVALGLLAHWLGSPDALDRCYRRRIGMRTCRSLESAPREPEARG